MIYNYAGARSKLRSGAAIALAELNDRSRHSELVTELAMNSGYIGFFDCEDPRVRVYVFTNQTSSEQLIKEAKRMGYRTIGGVDGAVIVKNTDLQRPHLKFIAKDNWHKELYK